MKNLGSIIGFSIAGIFVMSVWGAFDGAYGIWGGWFAGLAIISIMWFINHYLGVVTNEGAFVDMAAGIAICGTMRDVFLYGSQAGADSLPTLLCVAIGAILGGACAVAIEKQWAQDAKASNSKDIAG